MSQASTDPSDDSLSTELAAAAALLGTDPAAASERALQALARAPGQAQALALLVEGHRLAGTLVQARGLLQDMAQAAPGVTAIQYELGLLLADLGESAAAIDALSKVSMLEPEHPDAWRALGGQLAKAGQPGAAGAAHARHLQVRLGPFKRLEAAAGRQADQLPAAEGVLLEHLKIHPTAVTVRCMLARVYQGLGRRDDAMAQLDQCLAQSPGYAGARWMLTVMLVQQADWGRVLAEVELLLAHDPGDADYLSLKAHALLNSGDYDNAIACFEACLAAHPSAEHWMFYGYALATVGRRQDGIAAYRQGIALQPDLAEAYWGLSNLKAFQFEPAELDAMRQALAGTGLDRRNRWLMNFALGKALEDAHQYAESFEHYREGNAAFRKGLPYSAQATTTLVKRSKAIFNTALFEQRAGAGSPAADPIFVVGLPRSGSTLVEQILASHSMVEGTSELSVLGAIAAKIADRARPRVDGYPAIVKDLTPDELRTAGEEYIARTRIHRRTGRAFFIDKTPANFLHLGLIRLILPNAKVIDVRRHPLGCGFAVFRQFFPQALPFAFDLAEIGSYYRDYVEWMAHVDAVQPGRVHRVIYEQLVADPEQEIRRLLAHCGLPFEPACLNFHETKRGVLTPSAEQVRQPIFKDALEQWRHYEPWLGPMKSALGDVLQAYPAAPKFTERAPAVVGGQWSMSGSANWLSAAPPARKGKP